MQIERALLQMMSARLVLGMGVGALLMGVLNLARDGVLAAGLLIAGTVFVLGSAAGHWRLKRSLEPSPERR